MSLTVGQLAEAVSGHIVRSEYGDRRLTGLCDLPGATADQASFVVSRRYLPQVSQTRAAAVLATQALSEAASGALPNGTFIICDDPYLAMALAVPLFAPARATPAVIHPSAQIHPKAHVAAEVSVGAGAVIDAGARVARGCALGPHVLVGPNVQLGCDCVLHAGSKVLADCVLGERVVLQAGAVIGSDGFGFAVDKRNGKRHRIPQLGRVIIGSDVDIGANACVDRATFGATRIGNGCKIDNLVQVAHNCALGEDCVMTAQSGVAGSTTFGKRVIVGAQGGIAGHADIADDVMLAARAGVPSSIAAKGVFGGTPTQPLHEWRKSMVALRRLPEALRRLARLEARAASAFYEPNEEHS